MYSYNAKVVKVVDGDTIDVDIDLGFYMTARIRLRIGRIDAWEVRGEERIKGKIAKQWLIDLLNKHNNEVIVETSKTGKYGRWIAEIYVGEYGTGTEINVNEALVKNGHATYTDYD